MDGSGEKFGRKELAIAGGMTLSNFDFLDREELVPKERDIAAVKRVAVIGAFFAAGVPLLLSADISSMILFEFNYEDGEAPSNLNQLARRLPPDDILSLPQEFGDWQLHQALRRVPDAYTPGMAYPGDALIEIVDRKFVLKSTFSERPLKILLPSGATAEAEPVGRIENWHRGGEAKVIHVIEEMLPASDPASEKQADELEAMLLTGRRNAVGKIVVNISLGIRRGLDAIADAREAKRKKRRQT